MAVLNACLNMSVSMLPRPLLCTAGALFALLQDGQAPLDQIVELTMPDSLYLKPTWQHFPPDLLINRTPNHIIDYDKFMNIGDGLLDVQPRCSEVAAKLKANTACTLCTSMVCHFAQSVLAFSVIGSYLAAVLSGPHTATCWSPTTGTIPHQRHMYGRGWV